MVKGTGLKKHWSLLRLYLLLPSRLYPLRLPVFIFCCFPVFILCCLPACIPCCLPVSIFCAFPSSSSAAFPPSSSAPSRLHPLLSFCIHLLRLPAFIFCCRDCCWPGMSCLNDMIEYTKTILLFYGFKKTICKISVYTDCASPENRSHQSFHSGKFKITYRFTVLIIYEQHRAIN